MSILYTQQYMPVTDTEMANGSALSSHAAREMIRTVNNLKAYVTNTMLIPNMAGFSGGATVTTDAGSTSERNFLAFPRLPVPWGTKSIRIVCGARISHGASTITLRAYADRSLYTGDFSANTFSGDAFSDSEVVSGSTHALYSFTLGSATNPISRITHDANIDQAIATGRVYLTISSQAGSNTTRARISCLAAWVDGSTYA